MNTTAWNEWLQVAILFAFLILGFSLMASTLVEIWATFRQSRAQLLRKRLLMLFDDPEEVGFGGRLLRSPLIKSMHEETGFPSYIPGSVVARAAIGIIREDNLVDCNRLPPVLRVLLGRDLVHDALMQERIASWYEDAMARLSGTFLRQSRLRVFMAGLLLAIFLDVDAVALTRVLWADRSELGKAVIQVEALAHRFQTMDLSELDKKQLLNDIRATMQKNARFNELDLPIGRDFEALVCKGGDCSLSSTISNVWVHLRSPGSFDSAKLLGWLITALVALPGAHVWFDLLGRFLRIRATGLRPRKY